MYQKHHQLRICKSSEPRESDVVDESTSNQPEDQEQTVAAPVEPGTSGKGANVAVVVGAAAVLLVIAGLAAAAVYLFLLSGPPDDEMVVTPDPTEAVTPAPEEDEEDAVAPEEPPAVELKRVFTFRDIFEPLLQPLPEPTEEAIPAVPAPGVPADPDNVEPEPTVAVDKGTLVLLDIVSVDEEPAAVLLLDEETYTLRAGEAIPNTPWQVLRIGASNVVMLYGDVQVTLDIGQSITK